jgi:hypothetical protein
MIYDLCARVIEAVYDTGALKQWMAFRFHKLLKCECTLFLCCLVYCHIRSLNHELLVFRFPCSKFPARSLTPSPKHKLHIHHSQASRPAVVGNTVSLRFTYPAQFNTFRAKNDYVHRLETDNSCSCTFRARYFFTEPITMAARSKT